MLSKRRELSAYGRKRAAGNGPALANSLLWDVILQLSPTINGWPVARFKGRYYLVDGNPWPPQHGVCRLLAKSGPDLAVTSDGLVSAWLLKPRARHLRKPTIYGVNDDIEPVTTLPVAGADAAAGSVRPAVSGPGAGDDEQLPGGIPGGRVPGDHQPELSTKGGGR